MCGIAGKYNVDPDRPVNEDVVRQMTAALRHRGPDDEGVWSKGRIGLGNRRLAVIDLSERGHQPMSNEDGSAWIAYNGEIYGFADLRAELQRREHVFRSRSDTEVILHAYEELGSGCLDRLRGMFAFAIWDGRDESLLVARDRVGKKPLFYYWNGETLAFASEVRALLQDPDVPVEPDPLAIHHYLTYGYVPTPLSAFKGIRKLPAGHFLQVRHGRLEIQRYWRLSYRDKRQASESALTEQLLHVLDEAVRIRLVSDVPLGALLSGGLDSSIVVALMRRHVSGPLKTFSIGFAEEQYSELEHARTVARHFDTEHHEFVVSPKAAELLPPIVWHYGEPFADSSALPSLVVCRIARQHVTVALNGDGGDESFLGYDRYAGVRLAALYDRLPGFLRGGVDALPGMLPLGQPKSTLNRLHRFLAALGEEPRRRYARWMIFFNSEQKQRLYSRELARATAADSVDSLEILFRAYDQSDATDFVEQTAHADVQLYLADDLLVKMDIASMANSLEMRSPLLDHKVMEFAAALPRHMKLRGLSDKKYLLKAAFRPRLPGSILRRRKMGFGVPLDVWFRGELKELAYDVLLDSTASGRGYFRQDVVRRYLDEHVAGVAHHQNRIWNLLMLELWQRTYVDAPRQSLQTEQRFDLSGLVA